VAGFPDHRSAHYVLVSPIIVAIQPIYMHPYSVAKMVSSFGYFYRRRIYLNMVAGGAAVSYRGEFYIVDKLRMTPPLPSELFPGVLVSGSSEAGLAAARDLGATAVRYPQPADREPDYSNDALDSGIRVGIIAREGESEAWKIAMHASRKNVKAS